MYAPKEGSAIWYYHPELPEADKAVEDARKAGKDKQCPEELGLQRSERKSLSYILGMPYR